MPKTTNISSFFIKPANRKTEITKIIYDKAVEDYLKHREEMTNPNTVYVTDLVSCSQKRFFRINYPELSFKFEPQLLLGDLVHYALEKMLEEHGFETEKDFEKEFEIDGEKYVLKGRVDAISENYVVEIKTSKTDRSIPREHHIAQLQIYLNILDREHGVLIYITPDRIAEFEIERSEIDIEKLVRETVSNTAHPRFSWECRYCTYAKICPYKTE